MKTAIEEHKENCRNNAVSLEKAWNCIQKKNASRSAKPGQAHIPASPCPADTLDHNTPNSRHPGTIDSEVMYCNKGSRDNCQKEVIKGCENCNHYVRKHKLSEELE